MHKLLAKKWSRIAINTKGKTLWQVGGIPIIPSFTYRVKW